MQVHWVLYVDLLPHMTKLHHMYENCTQNLYVPSIVYTVLNISRLWTCVQILHQTSKHHEWLWSAKLSLNSHLYTVLPMSWKLCSKNFIFHSSLCLISVWKYFQWRTEVIISSWSNQFFQSKSHIRIAHSIALEVLGRCNMNEFWTCLWHSQVTFQVPFNWFGIAWSIFAWFDTCH